MDDIFPLISVIIPTYNRGYVVGNTVKSVLDQKYPNFEIIVIDDGSEDDTKEVLRIFTDKIKYLYQANSGVSSARNAGIKESRGEWVTFLDSDDEWSPEYLHTQNVFLSRQSHLEASISNSTLHNYGELIDVFKWRGVSKHVTDTGFYIPADTFRFVLKNHITQLATLIVKKSVLEVNNIYFNENISIAEDLEFILKISLCTPIGFNSANHVKIIRNKNTKDNLTNLLYTDPVRSYSSFIHVLKGLLIFSKHKTRNSLYTRKLIAKYYRVIGNYYLLKDESNISKKYYTKAFCVYPGLKSLVRLLLSFIPNKMARILLKSVQ